MKKVSESDHAIIVDALKSGKLVVLRTDTVYGILAIAGDQEARKRVFAVKGRDSDKKCIVLIADESQMWDDISREAYKKARPLIDDNYPTSIVVPVADKIPTWIHHDTYRLPYRIPTTKPWLVEVLKETGPLIAPSANPQTSDPAMSIEEAIDYFGDQIDIYVEGGRVIGQEPSHMYEVWDDSIERVR